MSGSFLFYDLETWGRDPRQTRVAQFAAIRTDPGLRQLGEPVDFLIRPADDLLPSPGACMVTGIDPYDALRNGVTEAEAFARIQDEMSLPRTCVAGYNSLRFDDEFIRHGLFRNFFDPYEREWRSGNCRWDLLDVMRLAHALRPNGISWPQREDGRGTSFRLEHLAEANGVREGQAHEALSDVRALIGMCRIFRDAQPRLWDYALRLRDRRFAGGLLDITSPDPVLHVSQRYPAARLCAAPVLALARHPRIDSRVIVFDLDSEPDALLALGADDIADRLFVPARELPDGEARIPLKEVHLNRCPALVAWAHLRPQDTERLRIDAEAAKARALRLREAGSLLAEKVRQVFALRAELPPGDADGSLYNGFLPDADRRRIAEVRATPRDALGIREFGFEDPRLPELLFRYRARNWPESLDGIERERWDDFRRRRLAADNSLSEVSFAGFFLELGALRNIHAADGRRLALLDRLEAWGLELQADLGLAAPACRST